MLSPLYIPRSTRLAFSRVPLDRVNRSLLTCLQLRHRSYIAAPAFLDLGNLAPVFELPQGSMILRTIT
jgi:hypothetical protein